MTLCRIERHAACLDVCCLNGPVINKQKSLLQCAPKYKDIFLALRGHAWRACVLPLLTCLSSEFPLVVSPCMFVLRAALILADQAAPPIGPTTPPLVLVESDMERPRVVSSFFLRACCFVVSTYWNSRDQHTGLRKHTRNMHKRRRSPLCPPS